VKLSAWDAKASKILIFKFENPRLTRPELAAKSDASADFVRETFKNPPPRAAQMLSMFKSRKAGTTIAQLAKDHKLGVSKMYALFKACGFPLEICKHESVGRLTNKELKAEFEKWGLTAMSKQYQMSQAYLYTLLRQRGVIYKRIFSDDLLKKHTLEKGASACDVEKLAKRYGFSRTTMNKMKRKLGVSSGRGTAEIVTVLPTTRPENDIDRAFNSLEAEVSALRARKEARRLLNDRV
jgi:Mor family transcriptional regulator